MLYCEQIFNSTGDTIEFHSIRGFKKGQFAQITHQLLPFHSYPAYHPGYSLLNRNKIFDPIKEKLMELVK